MLSKLIYTFIRANLERLFEGYRKELPLSNIDGVSFYGCEKLAKMFQANLNYLQEHDKYGWSLVRRYVHSLMVTNDRIQSGFVTGWLFENARDSTLNFNHVSAEFCSYLVRMAVLHRLIKLKYYHVIFRFSRSRGVALNIQQRTLRRTKHGDGL